MAQDPRKLLQQAHRRRQRSSVEYEDSFVVEKQAPKKLETKIQSDLSAPSREEQAATSESDVIEKTAQSGSKDLPATVRKLIRSDVSEDVYGVKPVGNYFNCYNQELYEWLGSFSSKNKFNGGVSIGKSTLIEIILDVAMYDMKLEPMGFQSPRELRAYLQNKIKKDE